MVEVTELTRKFQKFILQDISFSLPEGYIMGLVGENGAGKTTLLKILSGLYEQNQGRVSLFGKTYGEAGQEIRDRIGTVFHEEFFDVYDTLESNAGRWGPYYTHYDSRLFLNYAERFQLDVKKKVRKLSKGEYLKFSLAFALSHRPDLLILDEPSANFDEEFQKEFKKVLQEFIADGVHSVILSTHQTEDLEAFADYLLMLKNGRQLLFGDLESIRQKYRMVSGEKYKLKLIKKERVISLQEGEFSCQALVESRAWPFDPALKLREPTIAEIMYAFHQAEKEGNSPWKK